MKIFIKIVIIFTAFASIMPQAKVSTLDTALFSKANQLVQMYPIVDTHIDLPSWLYDEWFDVSQAIKRWRV